MACDVGQHKQVFVVDLVSQPCGTLVGQVAGVEFLFNHKVEGFYYFGHTAVVVLHIDLLRLEHAALDTFLREELDEGLVLGHGLVRAIECQEAFVQQLLVVLGLSLGNLLLGFSQILGSQLALYTYQFLNQRLVFLEHLVVALGHRTRDDERGTGIVNQH